MLKLSQKNILIPYERYENLLLQANTDVKNNNDNLDGQCISHSQHFEINRDKHNEYGLQFEKGEDTVKNSKVKFGLQNGEGGFKLDALASINDGNINENGLSIPPIPSHVKKNKKGPPGLRSGMKGKKKELKWKKF